LTNLIRTLCYDTPPPPALHTLSLHDALPILLRPHLLRHVRSLGEQVLDRGDRPVDVGPPVGVAVLVGDRGPVHEPLRLVAAGVEDRKSTRLNSSHVSISYAVFCLQKKKKEEH